MVSGISKRTILALALAAASTALVSCGDDDEIVWLGGGGTDTPGDYGFSTSAVVVVNPTINQGSSTTVLPGSRRDAVDITVGTMPTVYTDSTGLAVIKDIPVQMDLPLTFPSGSLPLDVYGAGEIYDAVVSYTPDGVQYVFPPVRYPIGTTFVYIDTTAFQPAMVNAEDNAVYVFDEGVYGGDVSVTAEGVLLFGAWDEETGPQAVFSGNVSVMGGNVRMRGIAVQGSLTVRANSFEAAFCSFGSADISGNNVMLLRNEFTAGHATVPSSSAILVDNRNIP